MIIDPLKLEEILQPTAKALGMRIKVTYNDAKSAQPYSYCIDAALIPPPRETYTVDEEMLVPYNRLVNAKGEDIGGQVTGKEATELLLQILDDMQAVLHKRTREQLDKHDRRGAIAALSREQKNALHGLIWLAQSGLRPGHPDFARDKKKFDEACDVLNKLFA